jgi:hypothetical protein
MSDTALRFQPTTVGNMVVDAKGGYVSYEELAAALAQRDKAVADADHFFVLSGEYLKRANDAEERRDKARNDALEQAAKVCDAGVDTQHPTVKDCIMPSFGKSSTLAAAIRAMKVEK